MSNASDFIIENGVLKKYVGSGGDVIIPNGVSKIGRLAFFNCRELKSVVISEGVVEIEGECTGKYIGGGAFAGCNNLTSVSLPESLEIIDWNAFAMCRNLQNIAIPNSVRKIGANAFMGCDSLREIVVPNPDCEISEFAFYRSGLEEITMPWKRGDKLAECPQLRILRITTVLEESWTAVNLWGETYTSGPAAFGFSKKNEKLEKVYAPLCDIGRMGNAKTEAVLGFAELAARNDSLEEPYASKYHTYIRKQKKKLYPTAINDTCLLQYMLQNKMIPLDDIALCMELAEKQGQVQAKAALLEYQNTNFSPKDKSKLEQKETARMLKAPTQTEDLKKAYTTKKNDDGTLTITLYKGDAQEITIPEQIGKAKVSEIEGEAFSPNKARLTPEQIAVCRNIKCVTVGAHIRRIGWSAFNGCENLEQVSIAGEAVRIESGAFMNCPKLADQDGFVIVHGVLFGYYGNAEQVTVPDGVKVIERSVFEDNQTIKEIKLPEQLEEIRDCAFMNCESIAQITVPQNVKRVMDSAFVGCKKLKKVRILSAETIICRCYSYSKKAPKVTYYAPAGSRAESYANNMGKVPFVAE